MSLFKDALADYRYFKDRGYPHRAVIKIIGDRYRLSRVARNCLFRGVVGSEAANDTARKIVSERDLRGESLGIDWFNVIITIESYLKGLVVFVADDGIVRDSSGVHGSYRFTEISDRAFREMLVVLESFGSATIDVFIDAPVSRSGEMAQMIRNTAAEIVRVPIGVSVVQSADYPLKNYRGIVASSDTIVIGRSARIFDLARCVLAVRFGFTTPVLDRLDV